MPNQLQLTKEGFQELKVELEKLVEVKRPRLVERISNARQQGDLSENSDYANAKEELEFLDGRIDELEAVIKDAQIVHSNGNSKKEGIGIGTKVTLKAYGKPHIFEIVGDWEADPINKKISQDQLHQLMDKVQKSTDQYIEKVDGVLAAKEKEILEIS